MVRAKGGFHYVTCESDFGATTDSSTFLIYNLLSMSKADFTMIHTNETSGASLTVNTRRCYIRRLNCRQFGSTVRAPLITTHPRRLLEIDPHSPTS